MMLLCSYNKIVGWRVIKCYDHFEKKKISIVTVDGTNYLAIHTSHRVSPGRFINPKHLFRKKNE